MVNVSKGGAQPASVSLINSSATALTGAATFTGSWEDNALGNSILVAVKTDQDGTLYVDFSPDGANVDSTLTYPYVNGEINPPHRLTLTRKWFRVRFVNGSAAQSYFRLQTTVGNFENLVSPLSGTVSRYADAIVTRGVDTPTQLVLGKFEGYGIINKFGRNPDIDTASVPEDIWNGGGVYAGFPTGSPEEFQVFSSSASDTGVLTFTYLPTINSTEYSTGTVTLNGTTPVNTGVTGYRMHTARYSSGTSTGFNVGTITMRHITTTTNIFCVMPIGRSQTNVAAYTVPAGHQAVIKRLFCRIIGSTTGQVDGSLWIRPNGGSPRLRRPFTAAAADSFMEEPFGGLVVEAQADIMVRISSASANNLDVIAGYDLVLVKS